MDRPPLAAILVYGLLLIFVCVSILASAAALLLLLFGVFAHGAGPLTVHLSG